MQRIVMTLAVATISSTLTPSLMAAQQQMVKPTVTSAANAHRVNLPPMLPTGAYTLTLAPQHLEGGGSLPSSAHTAQLSAAVTHSGSTLSMKVDDAVTLNGSLEGQTLSASGTLPQGSLTLNGDATRGGSTAAHGTFHLSNGRGKAVTGAFTLVPSAAHAQARMKEDPGPTLADRFLHWLFGDGGCGWFYRC